MRDMSRISDAAGRLPQVPPSMRHTVGIQDRVADRAAHPCVAAPSTLGALPLGPADVGGMPSRPGYEPRGACLAPSRPGESPGSGKRSSAGSHGRCTTRMKRRIRGRHTGLAAVWCRCLHAQAPRPDGHSARLDGGGGHEACSAWVSRGNGGRCVVGAAAWGEWRPIRRGRRDPTATAPTGCWAERGLPLHRSAHASAAQEEPLQCQEDEDGDERRDGQRGHEDVQLRGLLQRGKPYR